ncbi:Serine/threonine transporter SstT [Arenibacter antarcticus]|uniref:Cation:dicarboxylate symporter family transporter n=1 Tax=Arenibacter antarcticus TaxID=2040469 RepID=A0ABW5VDW5_9FLAO|nr:cation:dicarboxylase symporter family transporter [Arenibacter sp. H213]MCM4168427.1 hypothetical protein [Arenibacter sp. H213]
MKKYIKKVPQYIWTLLGLIMGVLLGGFFPTELAFVGKGVSVFLNGFIAIVPLLIFFALSPAIASLVKKGKGGKLATYVVLWYVGTSIVAGLLGVIISSLLFDMAPSTGENSFADVISMFQMLNGEAGASMPLIAILIAVLAGLLAIKIQALDNFLQKVQNGISNSSSYLGYVMIPLVFFLGITLGIKSGARESLNYYLLMSLYTLGLCFLWWLLYIFIIVKWVAKQPLKKVIREYYLPTAVFAAGTCSSLATLPINMANIKKYGVDKDVADFVLPVGSIINLDTSALAYVAYAPFILTVIFDIQISWSILFMAWPAIVLFTIAAPGLPAGMGTALWSSTLFASMVGLTGEVRTEFIATWIALSGGIPDMIRTATNCTSDGFAAIFFNKYFGKENKNN